VVLVGKLKVGKPWRIPRSIRNGKIIFKKTYRKKLSNPIISASVNVVACSRSSRNSNFGNKHFVN
jgi:hypothetical protein